MQGYNELREGVAWLDVSGRSKIRVAGEDRARLLHAMTTNHIQQLTPGTGCYAFSARSFSEKREPGDEAPLGGSGLPPPPLRPWSCSRK